MVEPYKTVHDTVHGSIKVEGVLLELMDTPEVQRLHSIRQLGLAYLVFPGANHTRFEHSLGTSHIAKRMARELELKDEEATMIRVAGLLHDLGHGPFSHTLEYLHHQHKGLDHMEITKGIITGKVQLFEAEGKKKGAKGSGDVHSEAMMDAERKGGRVPAILERHGLDPEEVAGLIAGPLPNDDGTLDVFTTARSSQAVFCTRRYLHECIHGPLDADQVDFLLRDAHYTGVAHGVLDVDRLIQTLAVHNNELVVDKSGVNAVEGMLVARALMYSSVYFHKTVRIAEVMLSRAVERLDPSEEDLAAISKMVDMDLMHYLEGQGGLQAAMVKALRLRHLYKTAYVATREELNGKDKGEKEDDANLDALKELEDISRRRDKEDELARRVSAPDGSVAIDIPAKEVILSEPRIHKTGILILDKGKVRPLERFTPLARALELRPVPSWIVMVSCAKRYREAVAKMAPKVLFGT